MLVAAKNLTTMGPQAVLLKGGHITVTTGDVQRVYQNRPRVKVVGDGMISDNMEILQVAEQHPSTLQLVVDVLYEHEDNITLFLRPRIDSTSTHGTGCTLSAAVACGLGSGRSRLYSSIDLSSPVTFDIALRSF
jgi:hydroxymethylpyrimidine/phosphomethylpyrimidine kinase